MPNEQGALPPPDIKVGRWIKIGPNELDGYVLSKRSVGSLSVGYYQNQLKTIKEDVVWNGHRWVFEHSGPSGSYLDGPDAAIVKKGPGF